MNEENFDKEIKKALSEKIEKPKHYETIIKNTLNNQESNTHYKNVNIIKKVACFILIIVLATSVIFSKDILAYIKYLLRTNSSKGEQTAIDNGYIEEVNMKQINSNGVNVKVSEILMDDYNLSILFNIEIPETESVESVYNVKLSNLIITDDKNNVLVLVLENSERYEEFYKENNIQERNRNIAYNKGAYYAEIITKYSKSIEYKYMTYSEEFPKSRKLNISFDKIVLSNKNSYDKTVIEGNWNIEVNLPEEMYNRETLIYNVKSDSTNDILITSFKVSNTATKIELITKWGEPVYTEKDSEEEKQRKIDEFLNKPHSVQNILVKNEYIENSNGEKFYPVVNSSDGNGGYNQMFNGMLRYWQTFNLTKYDATDTLKLVLEKQGETIEIELKNKN